ncbi:hypothetical protein SAMN05444000_11854 [Shimia gijangensis]|uniref:EthD domain-containing protein n=1 Tax=Shimia gijangensis TaxID=1470563 RepID=A0A1M6PIB8_9RHOB|nr:DUF6614 family protein [Shimia gijangensis]SHK07691.1 hypothetical protein SAMN05444000_11854 [Shimia gijangensis]
MIHMLSAFDLKDGEDPKTFETAYSAFLSDLLAEAMIAQAGPVGRRVSDTPMDTDNDRTHQFFSVMSFEDRTQLEAAYVQIAQRLSGATQSHNHVFSKVTNAVFTCWQDGVDP